MRKKAALNIDRLEVAYSATSDVLEQLNIQDKIETEFFTAIRIEGKDYRNRFAIILDDGTNFGHILYGSYNPFRQNVYILVDNEILYSEKLSFLWTIGIKLNLEFVEMSKLDLALDFNKNIIKSFYRLLRNEDYNFIILNKKVQPDDEIKELLHISTGTRKKIHQFKCFYIFNREGGLTLNCYDKAKEIEDAGNEKQYIKDKLGYSNIFRLEVRTNHKILIDSLNKIGLTDDYLYECICMGLYEELFDVYVELINRLVRIEHNNHVDSIINYL